MHLQDAEGGQTLFVDGGVYTRNRAFRLFLSSKAGKDALLQPTGMHPSPSAVAAIPPERLQPGMGQITSFHL